MSRDVIEATKAMKLLSLAYTFPAVQFYRIAVDSPYHVVVFGDPNNGSYEWAIESNGLIKRHSDSGYGGADIALRDGLIAFYGIGDVTCQVDLGD